MNCLQYTFYWMWNNYALPCRPTLSNARYAECHYNFELYFTKGDGELSLEPMILLVHSLFDQSYELVAGCEKRGLLAQDQKSCSIFKGIWKKLSFRLYGSCDLTRQPLKDLRLRIVNSLADLTRHMRCRKQDHGYPSKGSHRNKYDLTNDQSELSRKWSCTNCNTYWPTVQQDRTQTWASSDRCIKLCKLLKLRGKDSCSVYQLFSKSKIHNM